LNNCNQWLCTKSITGKFDNFEIPDHEHCQYKVWLLNNKSGIIKIFY
jgi:hypothetical protein